MMYNFVVLLLLLLLYFVFVLNYYIQVCIQFLYYVKFCNSLF